MDITDKIEKCGIIPVVVLEDKKDAVPLAQALLKGGINFAEVTFRTEAAEESIREISKSVSDMIVGAGTVLTVEQLEKAVKSGAKFIVSPGFNIDVINRAKELNIAIFPGTLTPTEITMAINNEIDIVKFFPSENYGGLKTIKALSSPFNKIKFLPTGGINQDNLKEYLEFEQIIAVGGSWICSKELIKDKNWEKITQLSKEARNIFLTVRG